MQVKQAAWEFLTSSGIDAKIKIIRSVYYAEGEPGLKLLARYITQTGKQKVTKSYLMWMGQIRNYKRSLRGRKQRQNRVPVGDIRPLLDTESQGSGGKRGRQGGVQNIRTRQFYQSV